MHFAYYLARFRFVFCRITVSSYGHDNDLIDMRTMGSMSHERSFLPDHRYHQTKPREYQYTQYDQKYAAPRQQHNTVMRSSVNYQGTLLQIL